MMYNNYGVGMNPYSTFDFDPIRLKSLGFTDIEIQDLNIILMNRGTVTVQHLTSIGVPYQYARKLRYMYDICAGKVMINTKDDISKHLKKMFGHMGKISIHDLALSDIKEVPRTALVSNIPNGPFSIWNSNNYPPLERMYTVKDVSGGKVTIETDRIPVLKYGQGKVLEGVCEIKGQPKDGKIEVAINKQYCRLCNRFIIVASLNRPSLHYGMIEIICIEGTEVYVYAKKLGPTENVRHNMGTQRVYSYGFYPNEIQAKLTISAEMLYKRLIGVEYNIHPANQVFEVLTLESKKEPDSDEILVE